MTKKDYKLPYYIVSKEVDKLYEKQIDSNDPGEIDKHCEFIADFIKACGYTEEEYIRAMFGFESLDTQN